MAVSILARSSPRNGTRVRVLAVHDTEGTSYTAEQLRDATWWAGSSHAIADERTLLTPAQGCVPYERASWTLRSGNPWSENIELLGFAKWTRAEWLARPRTLDHCARWLADRSKARGIPLVLLTPDQYRAGGSGVIDHNTHTVGYRDGTHWDVGKGFPWDVVLGKARAYAAGGGDDDMSAADVQQIKDHINIRVDELAGWVRDTVNAATKIQTSAFAELARQLAERPAGEIDLDAVETVVERGVADAINAIATTVTVKTDQAAPGSG